MYRERPSFCSRSGRQGFRVRNNRHKIRTTAEEERVAKGSPYPGSVRPLLYDEGFCSTTVIRPARPAVDYYCCGAERTTHTRVLRLSSTQQVGWKNPICRACCVHSPRVSRHRFFSSDCLLGQSVAILVSARTTMASILAPRSNRRYAPRPPRRCLSLQPVAESPPAFGAKLQKKEFFDRNLIFTSTIRRKSGTGINLATQNGFRERGGTPRSAQISSGRRRAAP